MLDFAKFKVHNQNTCKFNNYCDYEEKDENHNNKSWLILF